MADRQTAKASPSAGVDAVSTGETVAATEETPESPRASVTAKTAWPVKKFRVEGVPVITADGTKVTQAQLKSVLEAAKAARVEISHDSEEAK
jgi:hypothetical protein